MTCANSFAHLGPRVVTALMPSLWRTCWSMVGECWMSMMFSCWLLVVMHKWLGKCCLRLVPRQGQYAICKSRTNWWISRLGSHSKHLPSYLWLDHSWGFQTIPGCLGDSSHENSHWLTRIEPQEASDTAPLYELGGI